MFNHSNQSMDIMSIHQNIIPKMLDVQVPQVQVVQNHPASPPNRQVISQNEYFQWQTKEEDKEKEVNSQIDSSASEPNFSFLEEETFKDMSF